MHHYNHNRRSFIKGATASLALTALGANATNLIIAPKTYRVALLVQDGTVKVISFV
jgi:hypothetical protein